MMNTLRSLIDAPLMTLDAPVATYGDIAAEYESLGQGAGVRDISHWELLHISGSDHLDFLHRMCTNQVKDRHRGEHAPLVFTDARGRLLSAGDLYRIDTDRSLLLLGPGARNSLVQHLDRYIFAEDICFDHADQNEAAIEIVGPVGAAIAADLLPARIADEPACQILPDGGWLARHRWGRTRTIRIGGEARGLADMWRRLVAAGARAVGEEAWNLHRIEAGIALRDHELTDAHNPWEAGLAAAIDMNKGCYIGQEVIARLDAYDKIKQRLVGLRLAGDVPAGHRLGHHGKDVGYVSSTGSLPGGQHIGLGYVRTACTAPGTELIAGNDLKVSCQVLALPMS